MLTEKKLVEIFTEIGIKKMDSLVVHSSYRSLGQVEGGPLIVLKALMEVIGPEGNLLLPTFNYFEKDLIFDRKNTPCKTGIIPETGRKMAIAVRSEHPTHSIAAIGPEADTFTKNHLLARANGRSSPLDLLAGKNGKVLLIGVAHTSNTILHVAEDYAELPKVCSYQPIPSVLIKNDENEKYLHSLDSSISCSCGFGSAEFYLRDKNLITDSRAGNSLIQLLPASAAIEVVSAKLKEKPIFMACSNPHCISCRGLEKNLNKYSVRPLT